MDDEPTDRPDPVQEGLAHFQRMATEALAAARAMIDAAEAVVADPKALEAMVNTVAAVARSATDSVATMATGMTGAGSAQRPGDDDGSDGFERIRVD